MSRKGLDEAKLLKVCKDIEEHMKDPEYVKAMYDFIRRTSS